MNENIGASLGSWLPLLISGALTTVEVTVCALFIGALFGAVIASYRLAPSSFLNFVGNAYTTVFRSVPELLIIYLLYFGGPAFLSAISSAAGYAHDVAFPSFVAGSLAVGVVSGAYQAEIYRGAYLSLPRGQIEAGLSVGMSNVLCLRRIIVPQILRVAVPGLGNVWQLTLKDSALVSITGVTELLRASQIAAGSTNQYFLFFIAALTLYLTLTAVSDQMFSFGERMADKGKTKKTTRKTRDA